MKKLAGDLSLIKLNVGLRFMRLPEGEDVNGVKSKIADVEEEVGKLLAGREVTKLFH